MGQSTPITTEAVDPALAARIVDMADRDGPRAAYAALAQRLAVLRTEGRHIPTHLAMLKDRLAAECSALSQGR